MLKSYFKKKFGKKKETPANEKFYSPLRIALHSTVSVKTVDWIMMREQLNAAMVLPSSDLTVLAIGETVVNGDSIFNFYMTDDAEEEFILQLYCNKDTISESTLYKQVVNIVPLTESEWDGNLDAIGWNDLDLDDNTYNRVWSSERNGKVDFLTFEENVVESDKSTSYTNSYLLYSRTFKSLVDTEETEMLLVGVEESDDTAEITMMLGLKVPMSNITIQ